MIKQMIADEIHAAIIGKSNNILSSVFQKYGISYNLLKSHHDITNENMVLCVNYHHIVPQPILDLKYGAWTFHGSDLPKGRGWAPLAWTLINCEPNLTITLFMADKNVYTGMYYRKISMPVQDIDTIYSMRKKSETIIIELADNLLHDISTNSTIVLHEQKGDPTFYKKRTTNDSEININMTIKEAWKIIRSCHNSEYPAFFRIGTSKILLKYEVEDNNV